MTEIPGTDSWRLSALHRWHKHPVIIHQCKRTIGTDYDIVWLNVAMRKRLGTEPSCHLATDNDCSYERFSNLTPTAMIDIDKVKSMRKEMSTLPYIKKDISYNDNAITDTLLYIRATYKLTDKDGKQQELTQTFYMDKALTHVVAFKQN